MAGYTRFFGSTTIIWQHTHRRVFGRLHTEVKKTAKKRGITTPNRRKKREKNVKNTVLKKCPKESKDVRQATR